MKGQQLAKKGLTSSSSWRKVTSGVALERTTSACISDPSSKATPRATPSSTRMLFTGQSVRISTPWLRAELAMACDT